ncbi:MAG: hypothetical protein AB7R00_00225 [Kofleriaceae bacterium]
MADDELRKQLTTLAARVDALEAANATLRDELQRMRTSHRAPMHVSGRCPACGAGSLFRLGRLRTDVGFGPTAFRMAMKIVPRFVRHEWLGHLELRVCRRCLLAEWSVRSLENVSADSDISEVETPESTPPPTGPYR